MKIIDAARDFTRRIRFYFANFSWALAEKILVAGLNFLVMIFLARYLGAEQFGLVAYAVSVVALFGAAGHLGLSALVVRELVDAPANRNLTLGTSFILKGIGYLFGTSAVLVMAFFTETLGSISFWLLAILSLTLLARPFDVIDFWFQSNMQIKYPAQARIFSTTLFSCVKLLMIAIGAPLLLIVFSTLIQSFIVAILFLFFLHRKSNITPKQWQFSKAKFSSLFREGWMIGLGTLFAIIYLKIDQVMLRWMVGDDAVGVYSAAAMISEAWYLVPIALTAALFPKLIELKHRDNHLFYGRLQNLFDAVFLLALIVALVVTFIADELIYILFGGDFLAAGGVLKIHIWAAIFIFMRSVFSKWILIENALVFSLITQGIGAATNVLINFWLIPILGAEGAAYATLASYCFASYIALFFNKKTRVIFIMMTKSFISPVRYILTFSRPS